MINKILNVIFCFLGILLFSYCNLEKEHSESFTEEQQIDKEIPNDLFTFQRSFPYERLDVDAYEQGLKKAKTASLNRATLPGFDESWTIQGPGNIGGRINTIEVHPTDDDIIYIGFATGGVFKTTDGGTTWIPIFDDQAFLAIGDIVLDPDDPQTIYVGTGDPNISGFPAIGDGVYRSSDGGSTWDFLGLQSQRIISKIIIDPTDTDIIYAGCMGLPFERNNDRGLYKSTDRGATWNQVLFASNQSGVIDMVMSADDPQVLYVSIWDRIRNNEESIVNGPDTKIHKTTDGGQSWTLMSNGLPTGEVGRIGIDISKNDPDVLVAIITGQDQNLEGIYKTEDAGDTWTELPSDSANGLGSGITGGFGWYFGQIRLHPNNDDWIYVLTVSPWSTTNNGNTWIPMYSGSALVPHVDYHDLVFNSSNDILLANDGGLYRRPVGSLQISDIENVPSTQFYRVAYDPHRTQNYYGGAQDNGTKYGNVSQFQNWQSLLGGDGFQMQFHPIDSNTIYAETQRGNIFRSTTGLTGFINITTGINSADRRNWDMQYFISPHDPEKIYTGTYRVYEGASGGMVSWSTISNDLTDGNIFGSDFHTISTLTESPLIEGLLYVGTSDGNVWRSNDGGGVWDSLHATLPNRYITSVKASPDFADQVYVTVSGYKYNESIPRVFRSFDRGTTWESIAGDLPDLAVNDILVVPGQADQVLFVATDGGVYGSNNAGQSWDRVGDNYPMVTTYDLEWHVQNNELIAGTFGRSIYTYPIDSILNNIGSGLNINGQVHNENGVGVDSVELTFSGMVDDTLLSSEEGFYELLNLSQSTDCEITPGKDVNIRNGVSTLDILKIQKHILVIDTLDSPYKILAGDVNNSNSLSTFDIIVIRNVILFNQDNFLNTPSWKFISADYEFQDVVYPFNENYPESTTCEMIRNGGSADFIAIKMGDVTGNANPYLFMEDSDDRSMKKLALKVKDQNLMKGESYQIPIKLSEDYHLVGMQWAMQISADISFEGMSSESLTGFSESNFHFDEKSRTLKFSWSNPNVDVMSKERPFILLNIKCLNDSGLSDGLVVDDHFLRAEAYEHNENILEPHLVFTPLQPSEKSDLLQVSPNPFQGETELQFSMSEPGKVAVQIFTQQGKLVHSSEQIFEEGSQSFSISSRDLESNGLYFIHLKTPEKNYQSKVIFIQ